MGNFQWLFHQLLSEKPTEKLWIWKLLNVYAKKSITNYLL